MNRKQSFVLAAGLGAIIVFGLWPPFKCQNENDVSGPSTTLVQPGRSSIFYPPNGVSTKYFPDGPPGAHFMLEEARKEGVQDADIASYLAKRSGFDYQAARIYEMSNEDIIEFLMAPSDSPAVAETFLRSSVFKVKKPVPCGVDYQRLALMWVVIGAIAAPLYLALGDRGGKGDVEQ